MLAPATSSNLALLHAGVTIQYSLGPSSGTKTVNTTQDGYFTIHVLSDKITAKAQMITLHVSKMTGSLEHKFLCTGRPCTELFVLGVAQIVALRAIDFRLLFTVHALVTTLGQVKDKSHPWTR